MLILRFLSADGVPAFLTLNKMDAKGNMGIVRLVYPKSPGFDKLWDKGEDIPAPKVAGVRRTS